jgi:hypothetical protein
LFGCEPLTGYPDLPLRQNNYPTATTYKLADGKILTAKAILLIPQNDNNQTWLL